MTAVDPRFRRSRFGRFADDETLDRLAAEHDDLALDEQLERNAWVDSVSDADLQADIGVAEPDSDSKPKRRTSRQRNAGDDEVGDGEKGDGDNG